jgi:hypothetical protein
MGRNILSPFLSIYLGIPFREMGTLFRIPFHRPIFDTYTRPDTKVQKKPWKYFKPNSKSMHGLPCTRAVQGLLDLPAHLSTIASSNNDL